MLIRDKIIIILTLIFIFLVCNFDLTESFSANGSETINPVSTCNGAGVTGPTGPIGPIGQQGQQGPQGVQGPQGPTGNSGPSGAQGPQGERGVPGEPGEQGAIGPQGDRGPAGRDGPRGPTGYSRGEVGPQGPIGPIGNTGATGPTGSTGPRGNTGPIGVTGASVFCIDNNDDDTCISNQNIADIKSLVTTHSNTTPFIVPSVLSYPNNRGLTRSHKIGEVPPSRNFKVSFELYNNSIGSGWRNIIHITTGLNCCTYNYDRRDRVLALWYRSNSYNLHAPIARIGNGNDHSHDSALRGMPNRTWFTITIVVRNNRRIIKVNNDLKYNGYIHNTYPKKIGMKYEIWASDPWHPAANSRMRNFRFENLDYGKIDNNSNNGFEYEDFYTFGGSGGKTRNSNGEYRKTDNRLRNFYPKNGEYVTTAKIYSNGYKDYFTYRIEDNVMYIKRMDPPAGRGWGMNLQIRGYYQ